MVAEGVESLIVSLTCDKFPAKASNGATKNKTDADRKKVIVKCFDSTILKKLIGVIIPLALTFCV